MTSFLKLIHFKTSRIQMQKINLAALGLISLILFSNNSYSAGQDRQRVLTLNLDAVVEIAKNQSPQAILAQHRFRASYWQHRSYTAEFLPSLNLRGTFPNFNRSIDPTSTPDGSVRFIERNVINTLARLSFDQNIGLTGGQVFVSSELERVDNLDQDDHSYRTTPINIGYRQSLSGYNASAGSGRLNRFVLKKLKGPTSALLKTWLYVQSISFLTLPWRR
jgi:hypothetical protein